MREAIAVAREELGRRRPELEEQVTQLQRDEQRLTTERQNLLATIAEGNKSDGIFEKLGEVEMERDTVTRNADQARAELQALDGQVIDEDDLRQALGQPDQVWEHLVSNEKRHMLKTLIEQVTFNGTTSEVRGRCLAVRSSIAR